MLGKTHRVAGICAGVVCAELLYNLEFGDGNTFPITTLIATSTLGSLFPDIDHKKSTISKKMPILSFFLNLIVDHRGIMHTLVPYIAITLFLAFPTLILSTFFVGILTILHISLFGLFIIATIGFISGVLSHLFLDMLTPDGVPILYPIVKKKISLANLKDEKHGKKVLSILIIATFLFIYYRHVGNFDIFVDIFIFIKEKLIDLYNLLTKNDLTQVRFDKIN